MVSIIGGLLKNRLLKTPKTIRPTSAIVRKAVFDICRQEVEGARVLDLYAGSGAIGIEALSRGAAEASFVDKDRLSIRCIEHNVKELGVISKTFIFCAESGKALQILAKKGALFDLIYIDPPYAIEATKTILQIIESKLLTESGLMILEQKSSSSLEPALLDPLTLLSKRTFGDTALLFFRQKIK